MTTNLFRAGPYYGPDAVEEGNGITARYAGRALPK